MTFTARLHRIASELIRGAIGPLGRIRLHQVVRHHDRVLVADAAGAGPDALALATPARRRLRTLLLLL